jgi:hypothetical protein
MVHVLKCWPEFFQSVKSGAKPFEIRKADRNYMVGDYLELHEYDPKTEQFTEESPIMVKVTYMLDAYGFVPPGMVCMGLAQPSAEDEILWQEIFSLREKLKIAVEAIKSYDPKFDDKLFLHQLNSADYDQLMEELSGNGQGKPSADQAEIDRAIAELDSSYRIAESHDDLWVELPIEKSTVKLAITALRRTRGEGK